MSSKKPPLTEESILSWVEAYRGRTGRFPTARSGSITDAPTESWLTVNSALYYGYRGLPGGSSLAILIDEHYGSRRPRRLSVETILIWAKAHHDRTGEWPRRNSGAIPESPGDTWLRIHFCLQQGIRGLPGGMTLTKLLRIRLGATNEPKRPTVKQILEWAEAFRKRNGQWPKQRSGRIQEAAKYTWKDIDNMLVQGVGDLPTTSLHKLLQKHHDVPRYRSSEPLSEEQILQWAKAHHQRTGSWPKVNSGSIPESPGDTWRKIHGALCRGYRSLPGGSTLRRFLKDRLGGTRREVRRDA